MDTQNQLPPPALAGLTEIAPLTNPIIISDLHLAPTKPKTIMAFVRFMKTIAPRYPELVILGDLFDYWIGDDAHPEAQPVIALLKLHAATGRRVIVMPGNRDVMLGAAFARAAGAELIRDPIVADICGRKLCSRTATSGACAMWLIKSSALSLTILAGRP